MFFHTFCFTFYMCFFKLANVSQNRWTLSDILCMILFYLQWKWIKISLLFHKASFGTFYMQLINLISHETSPQSYCLLHNHSDHELGHVWSKINNTIYNTKPGIPYLAIFLDTTDWFNVITISKYKTSLQLS